MRDSTQSYTFLIGQREPRLTSIGPTRWTGALAEKQHIKVENMQFKLLKKDNKIARLVPGQTRGGDCFEVCSSVSVNIGMLQTETNIVGNLSSKCLIVMIPMRVYIHVHTHMFQLPTTIFISPLFFWGFYAFLPHTCRTLFQQKVQKLEGMTVVGVQVQWDCLRR